MTQTSYFISFLIFVATITTTNQALADALTPVDEYGMTILITACVILIIAFIIPLVCGFVLNKLGHDQHEDPTTYYANMLMYSVLFAMWVLFGLLVFAFVKVMINATWLSIFCDWLGTKEKKDTLIFVGFGMGGVLASINGIALHIRAREQGRNNKLTEKGHVEDRFKFATQELKSTDSVMLISAFYQFYYLAKYHNIGDFRKNIFDVLCFNLRYRLKQKSITEEYQILLDLLFKFENQSIFKKFKADLQGVNLSCAVLLKTNFSHANLSRANLSHANLSHANLSNADLSNADLSSTDLSNAHLQKVQLKGANLHDVSSIEQADFRGAKIGGKNITENDIPQNKGKYYANWTESPPAKPHNSSKNKKKTPISLAKSEENKV